MPQYITDPTMSYQSSNKAIVLVGLMGAGKSTIGRMLADRLCFSFIDSDFVIEKIMECTIKDIFTIAGEPAFRDIERHTIYDILNENPVCVLSIGGGAFINDETRRLIKENCISVWLKADLDTLSNRLSNCTDRPLLSSGDRMETLRSLMDFRYPLYAEADITIETGTLTADETADTVVNAVMNHHR